ncbi:MAG TPA: twin-arginine translocase subunit TatC [Anaerolineales bacterium]|nr:twin-arginine translocase subunit TatC [Anaerolineales bacterium]
MSNFFKTLWRVITFPFVLLFNIIALPFRFIGRGIKFLNTDVEDRPILDTFSTLASEAEARASLWEHINDLRAHLLRVIIWLAVGVGISFTFTVRLMEFLARPVGGLENLQAIQVTEEIGVFMRVALTSGIAIMLPFIAFEVWLFAATGLTPKEKKNSLMSIPLATLLFLSGMAFTFFALLPSALPFLGGFTDISQNWTAGEYFGFITGLMIWIGVFFEFPLVIYFVTSFGWIQPAMLAKQWRLAIVIIAIIAAMVTPTIDPVNMGLVMLPMSLLYFASIGLSYIAYAGRRKRMSEAETSI